MKQKGKTFLILHLMFLLLVLTTQSGWSKPTTTVLAGAVVDGWLKLDEYPLGTTLRKTIREIVTFQSSFGSPLYYIVNLIPDGFIIVAADDLIEPIIAFSSSGTYDPSEYNPLYSLVNMDVLTRMTQATNILNERNATSVVSDLTPEQKKWQRLTDNTGRQLQSVGISSVSDLRVAPLIKSKWSQGYNEYTPNHYPTGCSATAMSQLLRYHQHPISSVGTALYDIKVNDIIQQTALMGGDGNGGPYDWNSMPLIPNSPITDVERQSIGRLMHDVGAILSLNYKPYGAGGTIEPKHLKSFSYSNAIYFTDNGRITQDGRNLMINPNLDAGYPVLLSIFGNSGGHVVITDGYGYQAGTLYHHMNMGWGGIDDLWYNMPAFNTVDTEIEFRNTFGIIYNIYPFGTGEIVSGRVLACGGAPIGDAKVTASQNGLTVMSAMTNSNGVYGLKGLNSSETYTITAVKDDSYFGQQIAITGTSFDRSYVHPGDVAGNVWALDLTEQYCDGLFTISTSKSGMGSGLIISDPSGIFCGEICNAKFNLDEIVHLTATPNSGSIFVGWSGGGCSTSSTCTVAIDTMKNINATFEIIYKGDMNNDGTIDLIDAMIATQIVAKVIPKQNYFKQADVNDDDKIGLPEMIYIMQNIAGLR